MCIRDRGYGSRDDVALVQLQLNVTGNGFLRGINECGERLAKRRVPLAIVNQLAELESNLILVVRGFLVEGDLLPLCMCCIQDRTCLLYTSCTGSPRPI